MAARKIKTIAVDTKFFNSIFEKQRMQLQSQLGVRNLSQATFTKMITGLKIKNPKITSPKKNILGIKKRSKRDDFFTI